MCRRAEPREGSGDSVPRIDWMQSPGPSRGSARQVSTDTLNEK